MTLYKEWILEVSLLSINRYTGTAFQIRIFLLALIFPQLRFYSGICAANNAPHPIPHRLRLAGTVIIRLAYGNGVPCI
jgi:hypothetical protein